MTTPNSAQFQHVTRDKQLALIYDSLQNLLPTSVEVNITAELATLISQGALSTDLLQQIVDRDPQETAGIQSLVNQGVITSTQLLNIANEIIALPHTTQLQALTSSQVASLSAIQSSTALTTSQIQSLNATQVSALAAINQISIGSIYSQSANFTRPADTTAYAALDTVADSVGSPTMMQFTAVGVSGYITKAMIRTSQSANVARYRLHLYQATMTNTGDNTAFTFLSANFANWIGSIDFPACATEGAGSDIAYAINRDIRLEYTVASGSTIFARLETLDVFTPANAQTFLIILGLEKNA